MTYDRDNFTPAELLETAERLFAQKEPKMYRAAILEAISALEGIVYSRAFPPLREKLTENLAKWLEEKTQMDFDTRLSLFLPLATGLKVDKNDRIWSDYKKAKRIRNEITHTGKKVSWQEARFVIDTVYEWMAYINQAQETHQPRENLNSKEWEILGRFIQSSARLERLIYTAIQKFNNQEELSRRRLYPVEELYRLNLVDESTLQTLKQMRHLRNLVAHGQLPGSNKLTDMHVNKLNEIVDNVEAKLS